MPVEPTWCSASLTFSTWNGLMIAGTSCMTATYALAPPRRTSERLLNGLRDRNGAAVEVQASAGDRADDEHLEALRARVEVDLGVGFVEKVVQLGVRRLEQRHRLVHHRGAERQPAAPVQRLLDVVDRPARAREH